MIPARISSQISRHCWTSQLSHASALIQRDFRCVLLVKQTKKLPHVVKVDLRARWSGKQSNLVNDEEPLDNASHVWSQIILLKYGCGQALKRSARVISNTTPYHTRRGRTSLAVHNATVQRPLCKMCPDSNPTIVVFETDRETRQYRQLHSILPPTSFFHRTIGGGDVCSSASRVDQAMDVLRTDHSAVNGVEWYAQTLNDALQIQCAVLWFVMWQSDPSQPCAQFACPHIKWCTEVHAIDHVGPLYPSASNGYISTLELFGFV
ncbi:uncharacterized protein TNCV_2429631 [Trichonephila clavipes]|nr:uncharacterized protein TNCV_2429631 [Trichonephila clavipes]